MAIEQPPTGSDARIGVPPDARELPARRTEPTTAELLRGLADDATTLVRQEVMLAKQEMTEGLTSTAKASSLLVAGGVLALYGFGFLLASAA
ncbi:MAG TPA: phage holin family protein, partial [Actinomycetota bacterium]